MPGVQEILSLKLAPEIKFEFVKIGKKTKIPNFRRHLENERPDIFKSYALQFF